MLQAKPLFVLGIHRSGTTLLQSLLDGHPQILVFEGDSGFLSSFVPAAQSASEVDRIALAESHMLAPFIDGSTYHERYLRDIPYATLKDEFVKDLQNSPKQLSDYLAAAVKAYGTLSQQLTDQTKYWVEKTPCNEFFTDRLFAYWPDAKCIHILRDPRDVYASMRIRSVRNNRPLYLDAFIVQWLRSAQVMRLNASRYGTQRYITLYYEHLISDIETQMARVRDFLRIENAQSLYAPTKGGGVTWRGNSANREAFDGIDQRAVGRWRETVPTQEIGMLEAIIGSEMRLHDYHPECDHLIQHHSPVLIRNRLLVALRLIRDRWFPSLRRS